MDRSAAADYLAGTLAQLLTDAGLAATDDLRDVLPASASNDVANSRVGDAKFFGKFSVFGGADRELGPNRNDVGFGQLGKVAGLAMLMTQLRSHVRHVFIVRSKEEVVGIDARRIVALMTDKKAVRDLAKVELPRKAMSPDVLPGISGAHDTVSPLGARSGPKPTGIRLVNLGPKSIDEWLGTSRQEAKRFGALPVAELSSVGLKPRLSHHDGFVAVEALDRNAGTARLTGGILGAHFRVLSWVPFPRLFAQRGGFPLPQLYQRRLSWA